MMTEEVRQFVRRYPDLVLGENCGTEQQQIEGLKSSGDDQGLIIFRLQDARDMFRKYPALVGFRRNAATVGKNDRGIRSVPG
jgi:hypothetical protein